MPPGLPPLQPSPRCMCHRGGRAAARYTGEWFEESDRLSAHYPKVRIYTKYDQLLIRDGLDICFYMRRSHHEVAQAVLHSLKTYLRFVGPQALAWYGDHEGDWQELDSRGWEIIHREL